MYYLIKSSKGYFIIIHIIRVFHQTGIIGYCRSGFICEVLIFANFARRTNSRIQESRENYYCNSGTKEKRKFANSKLREKSQNRKLAKI